MLPAQLPVIGRIQQIYWWCAGWTLDRMQFLSIENQVKLFPSLFVVDAVGVVTLRAILYKMYGKRLGGIERKLITNQ